MKSRPQTARLRAEVFAALCIPAFLVLEPLASAQNVILTITDAPEDGLVLSHVDLTSAARYCKLLPVVPDQIVATDAETGDAFPIQFVPDAEFQAVDRVVGTLVVRLSKPGQTRLRLCCSKARLASSSPANTSAWAGVITNAAFTIEHDPRRQGGLPCRIAFPPSGKVFDSFRWNNRLHHRDSGSFLSAEDPLPRVERVAQGPICTVVRVTGGFVQGGRQPASQPTAVYDWYYFPDRPLVYVRSIIQQYEAAPWQEVHPLELNYPGSTMPLWAGGEPLEEGRFQGTLKSISGQQWGVIHDGTNGVGMFRCGQALLHDGGNGTYLQAHGERAWQSWSGTRQEFAAWLWIGSGTQPVAALRAFALSTSGSGRMSVSVDAVEARISAVRRELEQAPRRRQQEEWWRVQGAAQLAAQGRLEDAVSVADGRKLPDWTTLRAGDLGLILERSLHGIRVLHLFDAARDQRLLAAQPLPLFDVTLRNAVSGKEEFVALTADQGWEHVETSTTGSSMTLRWRQPADPRLGKLRVVARVKPIDATSSLHWNLSVENAAAPWSVWRVVFPQVAVADLGSNAAVLFPKGSGEVQRDAWRRTFRFSGAYPSGWTSMQFMAAYNDAMQTGLYVATHDPWGGTKDLMLESRPADRAVVMSFDHPVQDMGLPGNRFELGGEAVWQLLRGDWFDAAVAYRAWVRKEAKWYPRLRAEGRGDTPKWMRELAVWAQSGDSIDQVVSDVRAFTEFLGPPAAVHWYNWHAIPFDNDYPHYFPPKPGFADGVRELQRAGTYVMPYINGRLWDSHDQGTNDSEFSRIALPAVSKDVKGEPYLESYGSKESDGSPVRLGVMCPTTGLWQTRVRETVLRLMNECSTSGVYIDQVAAAQPTLCFDKTHGHPLGGGHWWTEGYWRMIQAIRRAMPADRMLTTECNGEPFVRCFDGYLTWHWQYDGQVPVFPAVYGGAIQMFGRAYGGGPSRDLALRMKAGQQLVFGEQIGWMGPGVVREKGNAEFLRQVVQLRRQFARYFYAGEMARPPKLQGTIAKVRADWQWNGVAWVTTDALLTGAWNQPKAKRVVLLFANVSDESIRARVVFDARGCGLVRPVVRVKAFNADGTLEDFVSAPALDRGATFPARSASAWEITVP